MRRLVVHSLALLFVVACSEDDTPSPRDAGLPSTNDAGTDDRDAGPEVRDGGAVEPLSIETEDVESGALGQPFQATIRAVGGADGPVSWTVADGQLPPGLALDDTTERFATLSGTPTSGGTFTATITVADVADNLARGRFTIEVTTPPIVLTPDTLEPGTVGETYTATLSVTGGNGGYVWSVTPEATLPDGLSLGAATATASIAGVPTRAGSYTFTIEVRDNLGKSSRHAHTLEVLPSLAVLAVAAADALRGAPYALTLEAVGGTGQGYIWSTDAGALPPGLTLTTSGTPSTIIGGTPTAEGAFSFDVEVRDSGGRVASASITIVVSPPLAISPSQIPGRPICTSALNVLTGSGGTPPYTWSVSGLMPEGWSLTSDGDTARLIGRSRTVGTSTFTVHLSDRFGYETATTYVVRIDDDLNAERWLVAIGQIDTNVMGAYLTDICGDTPSPTVELGVPATSRSEVEWDVVRSPFAPDGSAVMFVGDLAVFGTNDVYVFDMTNPTAPAVNVTNLAAPGEIEYATWSPDGSRIAFTQKSSRTGPGAPYVVDVTNRALPGPVERILPSGTSTATFQPRDESLYWSPTGDGLLFFGAPDASSPTQGYYSRTTTTALAGVAVHPAPQGDCEAGPTFLPHWSGVAWRNDGSGAFMRCAIAAVNQHELWYIDVTGPTPVTTRVNGAHYTPGTGMTNTSRRSFGFNAQQTRLFFVTEEPTTMTHELWMLDTSGSTLQAPVRVLAPLARRRLLRGASWNPAGTRLAFVANLDRPGEFELYVADVGSTVPVNPVRLSNAFAGVGIPGLGYEWSPDGTRIAYVADEDVPSTRWVYVTDVSGAPPYTSAVASPMPTFAYGGSDAVRWSPGGRFVGYVGELYVDGQNDLAVTRVDGAPPYTPISLSSSMYNEQFDTFVFRGDDLGIIFEARVPSSFVNRLWMTDLSLGIALPPTPIHARTSPGVIRAFHVHSE